MPALDESSYQIRLPAHTGGEARDESPICQFGKIPRLSSLTGDGNIVPGDLFLHPAKWLRT
jgi:hypothetical protein